MSDLSAAAEVFEGHRQHLLAVARRLVYNQADAEDVVQDAWLRFSRTDITVIENVGGWLTTCVTRLCLDRLRRRAPLPLEHLENEADESATSPEATAILAFEIEAALAVVMVRLTPAQRVALILHDVFGLSFDSIGRMLHISQEAARRQASRARTRIRAHDHDHDGGVAADHAEVVRAFLSAASSGDVTTLATVLHPDILRTADPHAVPEGAPLSINGRQAVITGTRLMSANARRARVAWLLGQPVVVVGPLDEPELVLTFAFAGQQIIRYDVAADPQRLAAVQQDLSDVP